MVLLKRRAQVSVAEQIRNLLREQPRTVSELAEMVYGVKYGTPRNQVHNRLKYMIANGQVRAERTGEASNALVIYHWAEQPIANDATPTQLLQDLEGQVQAIVQTLAQLRQSLDPTGLASTKP
jgi:hypothetical protein